MLVNEITRRAKEGEPALGAGPEGVMDGISGVRYATQIEQAAQRHGLDPVLLAAVAAQETGGPGANPGANIVGDGGHGHGIFQIDDRWHAFAATPAAMEPDKNADYAAGMLSGLLARYGGNVHEALSAYNAGSPHAAGTATTWGDGKRLGYADSVMRHYAMLGGDPAQLGEDLTAAKADEAPSANALADVAAGEPVTATTPSAQAAPAYLPQITVPPPIPYPSQFRSFTAMTQAGGPGAQADSEMIGLLDPAGNGDASA